LESLCLDRRIILKWVLGGFGLDPSDSGQGQVTGSYEHGSEFSGSMKDGTLY